ncbi:MAG: DnaJ domain-containing protein, partial [Myxococcales bacterium]
LEALVLEDAPPEPLSFDEEPAPAIAPEAAPLEALVLEDAPPEPLSFDEPAAPRVEEQTPSPLVTPVLELSLDAVADAPGAVEALAEAIAVEQSASAHEPEEFVATAPASFDPLPLAPSDDDDDAPQPLGALKFEPPPDVMLAPVTDAPRAPSRPDADRSALSEASRFLDSLDSLTSTIQMPEELGIDELFPRASASAPAFEMAEPTGSAISAPPPALEPQELPELAADAVAMEEEASDFGASLSSLSGDDAEPDEPSLFRPRATPPPTHAPLADSDDRTPPARAALADSDDRTPTDVGHPPPEAVVEELPVPPPVAYPSPARSRDVAPVEPEPVAATPTQGRADDLLEGAELSDEEARARRQRLLLRAFKNMGVVPRSSDTASPAAPPRAASSPTPPPVSRGQPTAAELELARSIEEKFAVYLKEDHFARLGVSRAASREQIKAAFFSHAKVFHPDRVPPSLLHLLPKVKDIFQAIRESYDLLQDDNARRSYLQQLAAQMSADAPPAPKKRSADELAIALKQGELALKKKDFATAASAFARAFAMSGEADHLAQQAWAIYLDPARKDELSTVKSLLSEALKKNRRCDRALYALGVISRVENDLPNAEKLFRAAIAANPKHAEAASELRLIERRKGKKGGLFS